MRDFSYTQAGSVGAAVKAHAQGQDAAYIAGGTTLLDLAKLEVMRPGHLVDVRKTGLDQVERTSDGRLRIGTNVTNTDLAYHPLVQEHYPVLSEAILAGAATGIRNKATTGGNIMQRCRCSYFRDNVSPCNKREPGSGCSAIGGKSRAVFAVLGVSDHCIVAHPSDMCVAMAAIGGYVTVNGPQGERDIDFLDFHLLPGDTPAQEHALEPGEMITHVTLDAPLQGAGSHYLKLRDRASYQFALASAGVIVATDGNTIRDARIALGGVGTKPWRAADAEKALIGQPASEDTFARVAEIAFKGARPTESNAFKVPLGKQAIVRALTTVTGPQAS
ncbi:xanthine dehydrogenase family protein subunit M [Salinisphaera sp. Q1T1-3]|uniref:FAD binding domain-containing protein n=1 Tax=Salinisphaera sp. Q1T1-3 TaxID=2321229 RepID=UPI000E723D4F|nr:xanthine dehydrogenase family protein subunit M [Salinisphaera sp. Q1T1-3]RJS95245.1 xanthine dehydrogenase family protein subunit M [Salinisphaera sp. Q1T1-3]